MKNYINVKIDKDTAIEMLVERVQHWTNYSRVIDLYEKMYTYYVENDVFDGGEFDVMQIVDNDFVNYCDIITQEAESFAELLKIYHEQGLGDCSCETDICNFIEAVDNEEHPNAFLVRV